VFGFILEVQWQAGGSLAATLSSVGRSIRDRLDVVRRVRAQAAEAQFSVIGILGIVYLVAVLLYRSDPQRIREFMQWTPGVALTIAAIVMQALGLLWMRRLASIPL
jgi:tight adherence protein B